MEFYPGKLRIPVTLDLLADESRVERSFAVLVEAELEAFVAEYARKHGHVIDPDRAREFCPDYVASRAARGKYSRATYAPAKALTDEMFRRRIVAGPPGLVRFLSGGAGSGKTTVLAAMGGELSDAILVMDGTLSKLAPARDKIDFCLAHGCEVEVFHLHRPFAEAVRATVGRAAKEGRRVEPEAAAATHHGAQAVFLTLRDQYAPRLVPRVSDEGVFLEAADPRVVFRAVFFSQRSGAKLLDIEDLSFLYAHPPLDQMIAMAKRIFEDAGD